MPATSLRVAPRAVLDPDYLQLTIRCWVVRMLFTFLQIGGELREAALDALFATAGRKRLPGQARECGRGHALRIGGPPEV